MLGFALIAGGAIVGGCVVTLIAAAVHWRLMRLEGERYLRIIDDRDSEIARLAIKCGMYAEGEE